MWLHPRLGRQRHAQSELGGLAEEEGAGGQESDVISQLADCIFQILNGLETLSQIITWFALLRAVSNISQFDMTQRVFRKTGSPAHNDVTLSFYEV